MLDTGRCEILLQFLFIIYLFYYLLFLFMILFFLPRHKNHVVISLKITFNEINVWGGGGGGADLLPCPYPPKIQARDPVSGLGAGGEFISMLIAYLM